MKKKKFSINRIKQVHSPKEKFKISSEVHTRLINFTFKHPTQSNKNLKRQQFRQSTSKSSSNTNNKASYT
jgi:hypothetical protein